MKIYGNLDLEGCGQVDNFVIEQLAIDPVEPMAGQFWYNTTEGLYKCFNGTRINVFVDFGIMNNAIVDCGTY